MGTFPDIWQLKIIKKEADFLSFFFYDFLSNFIKASKTAANPGFVRKRS